MSVVLPQHGFAYFSVPKCASSSLKNLFRRLEAARGYIEADGEPVNLVHKRYPFEPYDDVATRVAPGFQTMAVVREPVSRIVSCYQNKVLQQKWLDRPKVELRLKKLGLAIKPTLAEFVADLEGYQSVSPHILLHSRPLSYFLGTDPQRYTRIFSTSNMDDCVGYLSDLFGEQLTLTHNNKSKPKVSVEVTDQVAEDIKTKFSEDIALFSAYFPASKTSRSVAASR